MVNAIRELRFAARALAKRPGYSAAAIVTLALGIGANIAIFIVVNSVLLRPLPYPDADRIVTIRHHAPGIGLPEVQSAQGLLVHYRESSRSLTRIAGYEMWARNLTGSGQPERIRVIAATPELFDALSVRPAMGRAFESADAQRDAPLVGILTYTLWQSRFGGDAAVVGRRVELDGQPLEIVGVMPRDFVFPDADTRLIVPLWLNPERGFGAFGSMRTIARLAPGASLAAARDEITALQGRIPERYPDMTKQLFADFGWSVSVETLRDTLTRDVATPLWILFGSVGVVLLIAGANVANLFLVRAESRQREIAVRAALGGSRARVAATFLSESLLLALGGGAIGSMLASFGVDALVAYGPARLPRLHEIGVDGVTIVFAIAISVVAGCVLGLAALPGLTRKSFAQVMRDGGRGNTAGRQRHRVRQTLIAAQVAMALVLLVGSGLLLRSIARLSAIDPGFRTDGLLTAGVSPGRDPNRARVTTFYDRVLDELAALPGVTSAGAAGSLPIEGGSLDGASIEIASRPQPEGALAPTTMYQVITAGYFETLGVPLRAGRAPTPDDAAPGRAIAWVNDTFARRFLDGRAVGERIRLNGQWLDIVGVVGDMKTFGLREEMRPMTYLPLGTPAAQVGFMNVVLRTSGSPALLAPELRAAIARVDPSVPLTRVRTMDDIVDASLAQTSFTMILLVIAAGVAVLLGVVGLYGVISYVVNQRTGEIGVRLALGAQPGDVRSMVLRQGLMVTLAGVAIGLVLAAIVTQVMGSLLFEVSARDPLTFVAVALVLLAISAGATYLPARRAAGIDPLQALREEG